MGNQTQSLASQQVALLTPGNPQSLNVPTSSKFNNPAQIIDVQRKVKTVSFPMDEYPYYLLMSIAEYKRRDMFTVERSLNTEVAIQLPIPMQLTNTTQANWQEEELGLSGNVFGTGAAGLARSDPLVSKVLGDIGTAAGQSTVAGLIQDSGNLGQVIQNFNGVSPNQFLTVMYRGPTYRNYSFTWRLSPKNAKESDAVTQIIWYLQRAMVPNITAGGVLWTYPEIFNLELHSVLNHVSTTIFGFKPAVLTDMTVNYAPSGLPAFYAGTEAPESVDLTLTFKEIEFWLKTDYGVSSEYPSVAKSEVEQAAFQNLILAQSRVGV